MATSTIKFELLDNFFFGGVMDKNYYVRDFIWNQELLIDVTEVNTYCVIASLAIWVFSFIYFIDFGYFVIFSIEEQIYLYLFLLRMTRVFLKLLWSKQIYNWYCCFFSSDSSFVGDGVFHFIGSVNGNLENLRTGFR